MSTWRDYGLEVSSRVDFICFNSMSQLNVSHWNPSESLLLGFIAAGCNSLKLFELFRTHSSCDEVLIGGLAEVWWSLTESSAGTSCCEVIVWLVGCGVVWGTSPVWRSCTAIKCFIFILWHTWEIYILCGLGAWVRPKQPSSCVGIWTIQVPKRRACIRNTRW